MTAPSEPPRSVSVLMPTWQGEEFLDRALTSLAAQRFDRPWDVLVVDSGSRDETLPILERHAADFPVPFGVRHIHQVEFDHGDTRNWLAAMTTGELLVFLTQDAIPVGEDWLATLVRNFDDPEVGAAYCRNVPRPDADPLTKILSADDPGYTAGRREVRLPPADAYEDLDPHEKRVLYNFNDVASAVRRDLWERHPFPRTWFGEDVLMARALLEAGFTVVYDDEARVEHSHDYDADETRKRARIDGRFNREWLGRTCVGSASDVKALCKRFVEPDAAAIRAAGHDGEEAKALARRMAGLRRAAFEGLHEGGRLEDDWAQEARASTALLPRTTLKVLHVLHGFPPDTWAGTEIYTQNLALELQRRGHEAVVLCRAPAVGDEPDFAVREEEFQGLRVLRMTHRLAHANLRESYHQPKAEEAFRDVLRAERPDLVHFQHLIHTSAGLVGVAQEAGLPTVVTCHDYWALCARVQLIRPDGARCDENMGAGCFLCVKEKGLEHVERAKALDDATGPVVDALAAVARLAKGAKLERSAEEFRDLRDRHAFVTSAYAAADLRISPSRFLRQKYVDSGAFDPHAFLFSDNGMRTDHVEALEKTDGGGTVRFGFVGSLVWYKGGETMVRAMKRLEGQPVELLVYGSWDPDGDEHHAELRGLAGDNVVFKGRFDNSRLSEVYADIDVLIVPSTWFENSPITIHEAYLTHTPVVASNIGGMAEFVRDGVDGLHFEVGDDEDLARVLRRFVDEPGLLEELSQDWMEVKTIEENAAETEFRYRALCCRARARGAATLLDRPGNGADRREGPVDEQGADLLLLRPGGGAVEFDVPTEADGVEVRVDVFALGGEDAVTLGGRVLLAGREVGRIDPFTAGAEDEVRSFRFTAAINGEAADEVPLRLECALEEGGPEAFLRVQRVRVRAAVREEATA